MKRCKPILTAICLFSALLSVAQEDSLFIARYRAGRSLYNQAQHLRKGDSADMDYTKAFELYQKSAELGYPMGEYSLGYMYYKGLGCTQDYNKALDIFKKGAEAGYDNSMYFLGLCLRNGYGTDVDTASAMRWLRKADSLGSHQAALELASISAENRTDAAKELLKNIHNLALPQQAPSNEFIRIANKVSPGQAVAGRYAGYLIQYDWSGKNVVATHEMVLDISSDGWRISGEWVEQDSDSFRFSGYLRGDSLVFNPVIYGRKDHYSPDSAVGYRINNATLSVIQTPEAFYLAGNVSMFSDRRGEPSKPIVLALTKTAEGTLPEVAVKIEKVFPNPFRDVLEVQFSLGKEATVVITVASIVGQQVFLRPGKKLSPGYYSNRLELPVGLAPGTYILQLMVNNKPYSVKLVHV